MKKQLKDIILVSVIAALMTAGMLVSITLFNKNAFMGGKTITLKITYADREYVYANIKTDKENLYGVLRDYNEKLALDLEVSGLDNQTTLYSLKDTEISPLKNTNYKITHNGEVASVDLASITISDGDEIAIEYIMTSSKDGTVSLAEGGNAKLTFYSKVTITLYTLIAIILTPVFFYIIIALIKLKRAQRLGF